MAANRTIAKQVVTQSCTSHSRHLAGPPPFSFFRRGVHATVYDKNREDLVQQDEVTEPQSDKYWAPHPKTGVFGPAPQNKLLVFGSSEGNIRKDSILEEKAWFRPTSLEDLEKPF